MNCTYNYESGQVPYFRRKTWCTAGHSFFVVVIFFLSILPFLRKKRKGLRPSFLLREQGGKDLSVQFILDEVATRCEEKVLGLAGTRQETLQDQCACELERKYSQTLPQELTLCLLRHCPLASYSFFFSLKIWF